MEQLRTAADIMVTRLIKLTPETSVLDGIARLLENRITGAPVVGPGNTYLGVFSEKCSMDVLVAAAEAFAAHHGKLPPVTAADIMHTDLIRLDPEMDSIEAIGLLLQNRISGAPVIAADGGYLGVFSEKTSMSVVLSSVYDQMPAGAVRAYMDTDAGRIIDERKDLLSIAKIFLTTHYRRLPVVRDGRLLGQISRRDALEAALRLAQRVPDYLESIRDPDRGSANDVSAFMDHSAKTIEPDLDILRIATVFKTSPYRRLTVLDGKRVEGLVCRRDVLQATRNMLAQESKQRPKGLYLSAVADAVPPSVG